MPAMEQNFIKPVSARVGAPFGQDRGPAHTPRYHQGVDLLAVNHSPVIASADGIVIGAGLSGLFGGLVILEHPGGHTTWYAHLSVISVERGQNLARRDPLGASGGQLGQWGQGASTGPHLHHEHRLNGRPVDPVPYWSATLAGLPGAPIPTPPAPPPKRRIPVMLYGILKSSGNPEVWMIRFSDGALRVIQYAEYTAALAAGLTLAIVTPAELSATVNRAPKWINA